MESRLYFDGQTLSVSEEVALPLSSALLYGRGVFTTVAINDGQPFLWEKHWQHLNKYAKRLGIDLSEHSKEATRKAVDEIVSLNAVVNGRARLTFFDVRSGSMWPVDTDRKTTLAIITGARSAPARMRITLSPYQVNSLSPLAGIKSCNYLENILAIDEARNRGFDEAMRLNERDEVTSGCMANMFWLKNEVLYTPSLKTGCLAGTTRELVMENFDCHEVEARPEDLRSADAIFLTSAGLGIVVVAEFESRKLDKTNHPILGLWPPG